MAELCPCPVGTPQSPQPERHSPALRAGFPLFAAVGKAENKGTLGTVSCTASANQGGDQRVDAARLYRDPNPARCCALPSTDGIRSHQLGGLLVCSPAPCMCLCVHTRVRAAPLVHAGALHLMRMHIWGSTAPQNGGACPTSAWGRGER